MLKQYIQTNIRVIMAAIVAILLLAGFHSSAANAQSANTLRVSPVRTDIQIEAGEQKIVEVTVTNVTDQPLSVRPIQNDFIAGDESGTPALILDETEFAPSHSLKRFLEPLQTAVIPAGESKTFEVVIIVPADAQAGGYFGAVRFAPSSVADGGQVNLSASVASLILLTVPGDIVEKLDLTDFTIQQNGVNGDVFRGSDDLQVAVRFQNTGNVQIGPFGKVSVLKGNDLIYEADFNNKTPRDVILPDGARAWDIPLEDLGDFGYYSVTATFTYGENNQTIEITKTFWIIPWSLVIGVLGGILLLAAIGVAVWFFLKNYKRRILRSNRQNPGSGRRG